MGVKAAPEDETSRGEIAGAPDPARSGRWRSLPNCITGIRIAALPALWGVAALREPVWLGVGVALAALTDVLDGFLARRFGWTSTLGSRLDSVADHLLTASTALWLVWLRPEFFAREWLLLCVWAAVGILALAVAWTKSRRFGDLHLYSAKLAGGLGYLFAVGLLIFGDYPRWTFHLVVGVALFASVEMLVAFVTGRAVDGRSGTIFVSRGRT